MIRLRALSLGLAVTLAIFQASAWAASPTDQLRVALEEMIRILDDPSLKPKAKAQERQARVREAASGVFDFDEIARRALGRHWRALSEPEREKFVGLFRALIEYSYLPKIALYQGERIRFVGESVDGNFAEVRSLLVTRKGQEIPVTYRLGQRDGHWLIFDILVEGISLVSNYRSQFNEIIQRASYRELVRRIERKLAEPPSPGAPRPEDLIRRQ